MKLHIYLVTSKTNLCLRLGDPDPTPDPRTLRLFEVLLRVRRVDTDSLFWRLLDGLSSSTGFSVLSELFTDFDPVFYSSSETYTLILQV